MTPAVRAVRVRSRLAPRLGIVLGSGLGGFANRIENAQEFPFVQLPGFPKSGVKGHAGKLILGELAGFPIACLAGRVHAYEGDVSAYLKTMIRTLAGLGVQGLLLTNAAGSLRSSHGPGSLVRISDHINLQGANPLVGPNDEEFGPRFPDMSQAYDPVFSQVLDCAARRESIRLGSGVYAAWLGPSFETPAEIRALGVLGADLVGMSTVPEVIVARHSGLRCCAVSMVTNLAAGMAEQTLSHEHTLEEAGKAAPDLVRLIEAAIPELIGAIDAI